MNDIRIDVLYRRTAYTYVVDPLQYIETKQYIEQYVRHVIDQELAAEFVSITWNHIDKPLERYECTAIAWEPIAPVEDIQNIYIMPRRVLGGYIDEETVNLGRHWLY